ncbi:LysR family transcriptional regulator [Alcaligenes sp. SDU_A2]|uniref:LysR family transcriptional regulator n=1 Tax=Alcaligenes sp. SDU_A2 TaxID=3136634 RepID=UPI0031203ABD
MNLKQLKHIVAVADTLNFHRASERVFLTQSALSRSVASFEKSIGIRLFDRDNAKVSVTYAGQQIIESARLLLAESDNFQQEVKNIFSGEEGEISFGIGPFLAATVIPPTLRNYHLDHPNITFDITINDWSHLLNLLEAEKIEFFIADIRQITDHRNIKIELLNSPKIGFYCLQNHTLYQQHKDQTIPAEALLHYPIASVSIPDVVLAEIKKSLKINDKDFKISIKCNDILLLKNLLPDTDIIMLCSNHVESEIYKKERLKKLNIKMTGDRFGTWGLVTLNGKSLSPSAKKLSRTLCDNILLLNQG